MNEESSSQCLNCSEPVATGPGRTGKFCSRSCSSTYNNRLNPKRQAQTFCACGKRIRAASNQCITCRNQSVTSRQESVTLRELKDSSVRDASVYNYIRQVSRKIAKANSNLSCAICGYSKYVDVCHIQGLSTLPDDTTLMQAAGPHNFVILCKNHHWELDHDDLDVGFAIGTMPDPKVIT